MKGYTLIELLFVFAILIGLTGYAINIGRLVACDLESPYKCEVIRAVGIIVPPVGAVAGYIPIDD